jgi:hypothetical protein
MDAMRDKARDGRTLRPAYLWVKVRRADVGAEVNSADNPSRS